MTERQSLPVTPAIASAMNTNVAPTPPSSFEGLWEKAVADYFQQTGRNFNRDQIAQFASCRSVDDVIQILQTQSKGLEAFRKKGKDIRDVLKPVVRLVQLFNDTAAAVAAGVCDSMD
ncbi:hypothetical protein GYMLUDRAFT_707410 [Collybiopsis luxurians FD-317 M1]|uniref:Fungal STAND N-terminal Goodbye domain-containing protein n=1 Tax=Collybiopsis luxurians FD-317 M1 TaxID=944289 RepID=A0A0D0CRD3_9AGAR|nr:hypothetical protein GYMLUDRAFT_707410 [Collybiopsis luxurians FD-317 M1]